MSVKLIGFQILDWEGKRAKEFGEADVLPLTFCVRWIRNDSCSDVPRLAIIPVLEGDIQNPRFPRGKSSLNIRV